MGVFCESTLDLFLITAMCTKSCYNRVAMGIGSFGRIWFNLSDAAISILRAKLTITTTGDARALYVAGHQQPEYWPCRINSIQWRHNERECVSNHQPHDCLLNRLFKRRDQRTHQSSASLAFVRGIHRLPNIQQKRVIDELTNSRPNRMFV